MSEFSGELYSMNWLVVGSDLYADRLYPPEWMRDFGISESFAPSLRTIFNTRCIKRFSSVAKY